MYHRGTLAQFNTWHNAVMVKEGIPINGKVGFVNGEPAPQNQRTIAYSSVEANPNALNDYVWLYGAYKNNFLSVYTEYPIGFTLGYIPFKETLTMAKI